MTVTKLLTGALLLSVLVGCVTSHQDVGPMSERRIAGPSGSTVDWDLPETDSYWIPKEAEKDVEPASLACEIDLNPFVYHHVPTPPQYSYIGFRFPPQAGEANKACVVARLKAVPALTVYPKKK